MYSNATKLPKLAIIGRSCTGKTSVATQLHRELGGQLRLCGELISSTAGLLGVAVAELSLEQHRSFDLETRRWLMEADAISIVEGNFLDRVVTGLTGVSFIRLTCEMPTRAARFGERRNASGTIEEMVARDRSEDGLRMRLYGDDTEGAIDVLEIDTTTQTVEALASDILKIFSL